MPISGPAYYALRIFILAPSPEPNQMGQSKRFRDFCLNSGKVSLQKKNSLIFKIRGCWRSLEVIGGNCRPKLGSSKDVLVRTLCLNHT